MRKIAVLLLMLTVAGGAFAQFRADIGVDIPVSVGVSIPNDLGGSDTQSVNILNEIALLFPEAMLSYEMGFGPLSVGVGGRLFTFLVETVAYPAAFAELELGPLAVNLNVGGFGFLFFGLWNSFETGALLIPDLSAQLKIGRSLRAGVGLATFLGAEGQESFPYTLYLSGKFVIRR